MLHGMRPMSASTYPALYQINTRATLYDLGRRLGRAARLDDVPDEMLDRIAREGFDWVWMLGVWQTGEAGRDVSRRQPEWQLEYREVLPDFTADDVCGSPFAIREYVVNQEFGGPQALASLRKRLADRGVRLMLDFVPNHTALDHPWVRERPELYVHGTEDDLAREPANYLRVDTRSGPRVLAHGRDPYFPGWPDTVQLNYRNASLRAAMIDVLETISDQCDGVRCDMAMLVLPDVILRTWGDRARPADGSAPVDDAFWPLAIQHVREHHAGFTFMAEAYWDLEWTLQQQGFDETYDKRLYDRLRDGHAGPVRDHLRADPDYQRHSARFLENHDEPRAAAVFPEPQHEAAATIAFLVPGLRFLHDGELSGRQVRASNHLRRRQAEPDDPRIAGFYERLLACMRRPEVRDGQWSLVDAQPAWDGNPTWDDFIAFTWEGAGRRLLVAINYGPTQGQCYLRLPWIDERARTVVFEECLADNVRYERDGGDLRRRGLYLDVPAWGHHVFEVR
jgi:glycosidase